jgi:hypothetical protein
VKDDTNGQGARRRRAGLVPGARERAQEGRRRAAWAKVLHDVFPILSTPRALTRPFLHRDRWKD